jgi:regulatory protein
MRYLATRPRSRHELERRLRRNGATDEVVGQVLDRLAELGLADDLAFARWWQDQRDRHAPRGRRLLTAELRQRGVGGDVLDELNEEIAADDQVPMTEEDRARAALERHLRGRQVPDDPRALQRLGAFLVRRGFTPETARGALRDALTTGEVELELDET